MSDEQNAKEEKVFNQELSLDDLDAAAGGCCSSCESGLALYLEGGERDFDIGDCFTNQHRNIYGGNGFPNCAATVEDGSHCASNDACFSKALAYFGFKAGVGCQKAWR